jgi:LmbE family N-acetylglucosaminyl deacetylase
METRVMPHEALACMPGRSVLVLAPHADDEVIGCGGALAAHAAAGVPVRVVIATDGARGHDGDSASAYSSQRHREACRAAQLLGYGTPECWGLPDRGLEYGEGLVTRIVAALGDADTVYAPSLHEFHPDHRAMAMAAIEAVRRAGGDRRLVQYEVGAPLAPNTLLDITPWVDVKRRAMACFESQLAEQRYDEHVDALNRFRTYTLPRNVVAAEAFRIWESAELRADVLAAYRCEFDRQRAAGIAVAPDDRPLVSVVVRTVGRPELQEALASIALQTYPNIEVVLVAARAGLRLPSACGPYAVRTVGGGSDLGRGAAAATGIDAARGDALILLDEDDLFLPDHVARLVDALVASPGVDAVHAGVRVDGAEGVIDVYDEDVNFARQLFWNRLPIHAVLFRRRLLEACRFDTELDAYEDWDFWLQACKATRMLRVPGVSAVYRAALGTSGLTSAAAPVDHGAQRDRVRSRWLAQCPAREFEWEVRAHRDALLERDQAIADLRHTEQELRRMLAEALASRQAILQSTAWRLTAPMRAVLTYARRGRRTG